MANTRKPVIVRKFSRDWASGYAGPGPASGSQQCEIIDVLGKVLTVPWIEIKWVCYVRDIPLREAVNPERLMQKRFTTRPRTTGVWLRMTLTDGDEIEGLAANDRSLLDGPGLLLTPPDTRSNTQRIYIPHSSIQALEVVSLIGASTRKRAGQPPLAQPGLFPADSNAASG